MASAPILEELASDAFPAVATAAEAMGMGPADRVRLETVALRLLSEGVGAEDKRVPLWFAAALCRSAEQRRVFLAALGAADEPDVLPVRKAEPRPEAPIEDRKAVEEFVEMRRQSVLLTIAAVAVAQFIVLVALWWLQRPDDDKTVTITNQLGPVLRTIQVPIPKMAATMVADWASIVALAAIAIAAFLYWLRRQARIREIKANCAPEPDKAAPLVLRHEETRLFASQAIRMGLRRLRRHRSQPGGRLDVRASIAATIRAGGRPQARFRGRWLMPEYLLLAEREAPRDHLAAAGKALAERIKAENVALGHYEFRGRPDRLRAAGGGHASVPLASVIARHADARSMLLAEGFDLRRSALTPAWVERLADAGPVVHLNPRLGGGRAEGETLLAEDGIDSFPLTGRGITAMAQRLADPRGLHGLLAAGGAHYDLPRDFGGERKLLLGEERPSDTIVAGVLEDLSAWFDPDAYRWFASLALFPYLEPALTLYMGSHLRDANGEPVLTDARYLAIARLPWLRAGSMPRWLREALARTLDPETLASATAAIQAFLLPEGSEIGIEHGRDPERRRLLLTWLKASPESELNDNILIDMFRGRAPENLGVRPAEALARRLRRWREDPTVRLYAVVAAAMALVLIFRPPAPSVLRDTGETELTNMQEIDYQPVPTPVPTASPTEEIPADNGSAPVENTTQVTPTPQPTASAAPTRPEDTRPLLAGPFIIYFDWDKDTLTPEAQSILDDVIQSIQKTPRFYRVRVETHTDTERPAAYAQQLTERMAKSIADYLVSRGVPRSEIETQAFGKMWPEFPTPNGVREPQDRRAVITIVDPYARADPQGLPKQRTPISPPPTN